MDAKRMHLRTENAQLGKAYIIESSSEPVMCVGDSDQPKFLGWKIFIDSFCRLNMVSPDVMIDELEGDYDLVIRPAKQKVESTQENILDIAATLRDGVVSLNTNVKAALDGVLERSVMTEERFKKIQSLRKEIVSAKDAVDYWSRQNTYSGYEDIQPPAEDWESLRDRTVKHFEQKLAEKELEFRNA